MSATLKPAEIKVRKGHNVRHANGKLGGHNDVDFDKSVATLGVLVPLLVEQDGDDFYLVAGHRRLAAAKKAKLEEVPVAVVEYEETDGGTTRDSAAAVENISRSQLNKVEEAMAVKRLLDSGHFTDQGVREVLGVSARWVTERKLILEVPESWHPLVADGYLNPQELRVLVSIATVSEKLADALLAFNKGAYKEGCRVDSWAIGRAVEDADGLWLVGGWRGVELGGLDLPAEAKEKLPKLARTEYGYREEWKPEFKTADFDRLRAGGVLWESDEKGPAHHRTRVATDIELLRDIVVEKIEKARPPKKTASPTPGGSSPGGGAAENRKKRGEIREKIAGLQTTARGLNLELGANLIKGLATVKLTPDLADFVLAQIVYHPEERASMYSAAPSLGWSIEELANGGIRYCHPDYQTEETLKSGKAKITYLDKGEAAKKLSAWMKAAKTPEEKLGRLVIAVALAEYAIDEVVPNSKRYPSSGAGFAEDALAKLVDGHLPVELEKTRKALETAESQLQRLK